MSSIKKIFEGVRVEWKPLMEVALISAAGVDKKIIKTENPVTLLNYMDVYIEIHISMLKYQQCKLQRMMLSSNSAMF